MDVSYSAKEVVVFHNLPVEEKKLLKMYRRHYLMMIIYLLFISCLYIYSKNVYKKWSIVYIKWRNVYKKWSVSCTKSGVSCTECGSRLLKKIIVYRIVDVYTIQWYNRVEEMR